MEQGLLELAADYELSLIASNSTPIAKSDRVPLHLTHTQISGSPNCRNRSANLSAR